jgi:hypothetical protein
MAGLQIKLEESDGKSTLVWAPVDEDACVRAVSAH